MEYENILTSVINRVGIITLNHEETGIINAPMLQELALQIALWNEDNGISVIIIRGKRLFSNGINTQNITPSSYDEMQKCFMIISNSQKIIIASVSGNALGIGFELALACDFIIASNDAKFAFPEISLGIIPCFGGIQRLAKTIGKSKTSEAVLTGRAFGAEEAERNGIINRIVPTISLLEDCIKTANKICEQNVKTLRIAKQTISAAFDGLREGIDIEKSNGELCILNRIIK